MRFRRARALAFTAALAASAFWTGCDPKLTGTQGGGNGSDDDDELPQISDAARAVGQVVGLHMDLIQAAFAHAAEFDTAAAPATRSIFPASCIEVTEVDPEGPVLKMSVDGCVDNNGTIYGGSVALEPHEAVDGFLLVPYTDMEGLLAASNAANPIYNHSYQQGSLTFTFTRGAGGVDHIEVSSALRHEIFTTVATFQYLDFEFTGSPGSFSSWPGADAAIQVGWDGVGVFTIEMNGSPQATFRLQGVDYVLNLGTGAVELAVS